MIEACGTNTLTVAESSVVFGEAAEAVGGRGAGPAKDGASRAHSSSSVKEACNTVAAVVDGPSSGIRAVQAYVSIRAGATFNGASLAS